MLSECGKGELAYELLFKQDYPSWLYQVTKGATTVWEHWDGIKEDGSFWSPDMNSFNHYAYGAIGEWLYRYVAGIGPDEAEPGFKVIHIKPQPGAGMDFAQATVETMYGPVSSSWRRSADGGMEIGISIPANASGVAVLPGAQLERLQEQALSAGQAAGIREMKAVSGGVECKLGSGSYQFNYNLLR
ncbi:Bacterial alpha-L-rhamnosidase [compost metagenome]